MQLQIINAHTLLGFAKSENIIDIPCTSSKPINVMAITSVFLHLEPGYDLNTNDGNLDNHKGEIAQTNSILLSLPVDQKYNNMIKYTKKNSSKMWHSFSKCVKVLVSVSKVSVNVLYFQKPFFCRQLVLARSDSFLRTTTPNR